MRALMRTSIAAVMLIAAVAPPAGAFAAGAPSRVLVCVTAPTGSLAGPATPTIQPPVPAGAIRPTTGTGGPVTTVPGVLLLAPQPQAGAYVVPTLTTMPSLPGVTIVAPLVLIPPLSAPGQNRALITTGQLQSAAAPTGAAPVCY